MRTPYDVRRDRVLFLDVEMTFWNGEPPPGEQQEIIEFGLAELDVATLAVTRSASVLVRPVWGRVSPECERLTGHTQAKLMRDGRPLAEVLRRLNKEFGLASKAWMAWGHDRRAIERDCARAGVEVPFSPAFHDVGFQFGMMTGQKAGVSLSRAMELTGVERRGRAHTAVSDAVATAETWAVVAGHVRTTYAPKEDVAPGPTP